MFFTEYFFIFAKNSNNGYTDFRGVFVNDQLRLSVRQQEQFKCKAAGDLFPEYYILRVDEFNKSAVSPLDEWFLFLKTGEFSDHTTAPGLPEAKERLRRDKMSREEQRDYDAHLENLRYQRSVIQTGIIEGKAEGLAEGLEKGEALGLEKVTINAHLAGYPLDAIVTITGLSVEQITEILKKAGLV